jgi:hypothetical protein
MTTALLGSALVEGSLGGSLNGKKKRSKRRRASFHNPPVIVSSGSLLIESGEKLPTKSGTGPFIYSGTAELISVKIVVINSVWGARHYGPYGTHGFTVEISLVPSSGAPVKRTWIQGNPLVITSELELDDIETDYPHPERPYRYYCESKEYIRWDQVIVKYKIFSKTFTAAPIKFRKHDIDMRVITTDHLL